MQLSFKKHVQTANTKIRQDKPLVFNALLARDVPTKMDQVLPTVVWGNGLIWEIMNATIAPLGISPIMFKPKIVPLVPLVKLALMQMERASQIAAADIILPKEWLGVLFARKELRVMPLKLLRVLIAVPEHSPLELKIPHVLIAPLLGIQPVQKMLFVLSVLLVVNAPTPHRLPLPALYLIFRSMVRPIVLPVQLVNLVVLLMELPMRIVVLEIIRLKE